VDTILSWIAIGVGIAGTLLGLVFGRGEATEDRMRSSWIAAIISIIAALALFLAAFILKHEPFAYGQRMGYGILIGGILGALAGIYATRTGEKSPWSSGIASAGLVSIALLGAGLVMLIFANYPQPALGGYIIGAIVSAVIFRFAFPGLISIEAWGLSAAVLGSTILLATFRYWQIFDRFWWRAPLMIVAGAIIAQIVGASFTREDKRFSLPALIASIITLGLAAVFSWKLFPQWSVFFTAIAGIGTFAVIAWLAGAVPASNSAASICVLSILAFSAIGFKLLAGFGIGIALLAAWAILLPALASIRQDKTEQDGQDVARVVIFGMFIGVGTLLYRLFLETYSPEIRGLDLRMHYTLIALGFGAVFPFALVSFFPVTSRRDTGWRAVGAVAAGLFAAVLPLAVLVLWGFKATLGFIVGTIAAEIFILFSYSGAVKLKDRSHLQSVLLVLIGQVSVLMFSGLLGSLTMTRKTKIIVFGCVVLVGLIWAGISAFLARGSKKEGL
jgi:hypothetical protein